MDAGQTDLILQGPFILLFQLSPGGETTFQSKIYQLVYSYHEEILSTKSLQGHLIEHVPIIEQFALSCDSSQCTRGSRK